MCGIFGWSMKSGRVSPEVRGILASVLSRLNDDRGGHSWGMCALDPTSKDGLHIVRGMGDLYYNSAEVAHYEHMYAHTRWATTGEKTYKNAHPFEIEHIVGAHNGMVYNHAEIATQYGRVGYEVDSMHIFAHIAEGLQLSDLDGYGAIEWVDRSDLSRIYLTKLHGGELSVYYIGSIEDPDGVVWSSEADHIEEAFMCAGIPLYGDYEVVRNRIHFVHNGALFNTGRKLKLHHTVSTKVTYKNVWEKFGVDDTKWEADIQELLGKEDDDKVSERTHRLTGIDETDLSDWRAWNDYCMQEDDESDKDTEEGYGG